jgi:hypothetical protein
VREGRTPHTQEHAYGNRNTCRIYILAPAVTVYSGRSGA